MTRAPLPMIKTIYERFARTASVFWRFRYDTGLICRNARYSPVLGNTHGIIAL